MPGVCRISPARAARRWCVVRTRMDLLGPLLVRLDDGQGVQLHVGRLLAGRVAVQPSVDVDARPLCAGQRAVGRAAWATLTEEPASRTTPYLPAHAVSSASSTQPCLGRLPTLSHRDGQGPEQLSGSGACSSQRRLVWRRQSKKTVVWRTSDVQKDARAPRKDVAAERRPCN